jgi:hypothetical protein
LEKVAHYYASSFRSVSFFNHALEMLLHDVWESEVESTSDDTPKGLLIKTIEFLKQYDDYLDVVVNCTRKSELAMWEHLFAVIGSPQSLFEVFVFHFFVSTCFAV